VGWLARSGKPKISSRSLVHAAKDSGGAMTPDGSVWWARRSTAYASAQRSVERITLKGLARWLGDSSLKLSNNVIIYFDIEGYIVEECKHRRKNFFDVFYPCFVHVFQGDFDF
jgi:hypothetical protein